MRRRPRSKLTAAKQIEVLEHLKQYLPTFAETAKAMHVSESVVSRLYKANKARPALLQELHDQLKDQEEAEAALKIAFDQKMDSEKPLTNMNALISTVAEPFRSVMKRRRVNDFLKNDEKMSYRMGRLVTSDPNTQGKKAQRQRYCRLFINLLACGATIINYDETAVVDCIHPFRFWMERGKPRRQFAGKPVARLSVITAIDTLGRCFLKVIKDSCDRYTTIDTLQELVTVLQAADPNFRQTTYIAMDGASHHTAAEVIEFFEANEIKVLIMSPQSPQVAPVEKVHAYMKRSDLREYMEENNFR